MNVSKERLGEIYEDHKAAAKRYRLLEKKFKEKYGFSSCEFFSAPGRTELIGNHTDHNGGKVIAGSVSMDTIAAAIPNGTNTIRIISEGYDKEIVVDLDKPLYGVGNKDSSALIYGMTEAIKYTNYSVQGFSAYVSTNVIAASGVSSSASFEMLICSIINYFFNDGKMNYIEYAHIGQYAENKYWGKASGLMDQLACAVGGIIELDFKDDVKYESIPFDFDRFKYRLILVNSEMNHAELSDEYSAVPNEMLSVANSLKQGKLGDSGLEDLLANLNETRCELKNDRAILRSIHFYKENERVEKFKKAITDNNVKQMLALINASGNSSWKYLQNCYVPGNSRNQNMALNLALSELLNEELHGVCRVHGGGFSGVILEIVPEENADKYITAMSQLAGKDNIYSLSIRKMGAIHV